MTEEEFEKLRAWGDALTEDVRPEVRAAGRAILLLTTEVERLQVELWHLRLGVSRPPQEAGISAPDPYADPLLEPDLQGRFRSVIGQAARVTRRFQPARRL